MAERLTAVEVLGLLDDFELSDSESEGEEDSQVTAYRGSSIVDPEDVRALGEAVSTQAPGSTGRETASSSLAPAFWDSSDEEGMEEDFQGKNKH